MILREVDYEEGLSKFTEKMFSFITFFIWKSMEIFNEMQKFLHTSINTFNLLSTWNKILSKIIYISEKESLDCECVQKEYVDI